MRLRTGTWAWGLDRLLLGAAMSEDGLALLDRVLPVDDVSSGDVDLVGRFAELMTRLQQLRDAMSQPHPVAEWVSILGGALTDLMEVGGPMRGNCRTPQGRSQPWPTTPSVTRRRWSVAGRHPLAARRSLTGRPTRSQLPLRRSHSLRAGPDAIGPAPRDLSGRDGRCRLPRISALDGDDVWRDR